MRVRTDRGPGRIESQWADKFVSVKLDAGGVIYRRLEDVELIKRVA